MESDTKSRPSPFGPAHTLLPENQKIILVSAEITVAHAIQLLIDKRFSQFPVQDAGGKIIGVFSYRSVGARIFQLRDRGPSVSGLPVGECLEPARFLDPEAYIDTSNAADFREDDYILVGSPEKIVGILTVADVFSRLNDFAEAFVLIHEIEVSLRRLIQEVLGTDGLSQVLNDLNSQKRSQGVQIKPLRDINECTFSHYKEIITDRSKWSEFQKHFPLASRELLNAEISSVNDKRNEVFHFRKKITRSDTLFLRAFRDRFRIRIPATPETQTGQKI